MRFWSGLVVLSVLIIGGCPAGGMLELGPVVETTIRAGTYTGEVGLTVKTIQNGVVTNEQTTTQELSQVIGEQGLPIIASVNSPPRVNLILSSNQGGLQTTQRVASVDFDGSVLRVVLDTTLALGVFRLTGTETITYELIDDRTLAYTTMLSASTPTINGRSGGIAWEGSATLIRQ